ncbi:MAG: peptidylprolyl isomerase [bacterium]|jgi:peptidyl-prolyl cis-trans isomerase C|nr:peptidylprolyl isomerase [Betaproteobacteria bacterium]
MKRLALQRSVSIAVFAAAGLLATTSAFSQAKGPGTAARVNGVTVPQSRIDMMLKQQIQRGAPDTPEMRARIREELISMEAVSQEAAKRGFDKNPDVLIQLELARQNILAQAYIADYIAKNPTSDAAMKAEYDKIRSTLGDREYRVRHILVKTEAEAKEIMAAIAAKKTTFEKAAAERSEDAGSKGRGGELDWTPPANLVKPFADAMVKLKKGQTAPAPVQSQFGWHIIRLDDERPLTAPPYEEVKQQLQQRFQQQAIEKAISEVRAKAKIE